MTQESDDYKKIKDKVTHQKVMYAVYDPDMQRRVLCPHVLGYKKENREDINEERALCYQLDGPGEPPVGWRSFDVNMLSVSDDIPPNPWETPPTYSFKWQNAVKNPKHHV